MALSSGLFSPFKEGFLCWIEMSSMMRKFVCKSVTTFISWTWKWQDQKEAFTLSTFFFSLLTLCHFYFLVNPSKTRTLKNDFNTVQTGLCFASCDGEALLYNFTTAHATASKIIHSMYLSFPSLKITWSTQWRNLTSIWRHIVEL